MNKHKAVWLHLLPMLSRYRRMSESVQHDEQCSSLHAEGLRSTVPMVLTIWMFHAINHNKERFNESLYTIMQQVPPKKHFMVQWHRYDNDSNKNTSKSNHLLIMPHEKVINTDIIWEHCFTVGNIEVCEVKSDKTVFVQWLSSFCETSCELVVRGLH